LPEDLRAVNGRDMQLGQGRDLQHGKLGVAYYWQVSIPLDNIAVTFPLETYDSEAINKTHKTTSSDIKI
jgi:hypothetical protein